MKKTILGLVLVSVLLPSILFACGGVLSLSFDDLKAFFPNQKSHSVFINYENGIEHLTAGLSMDIEKTKNVAWIIPIPASPESIQVDILDKRPKVTSRSLKDVLNSKVEKISTYWITGQVWPWLPYAFFYSRMLGVGGAGMAFLPYGQEVVTYSSLTKNGITSEVLSAKSSEALVNYLKNKGLEIGKDSLSVFEKYTNSEKEFSFVASWVVAEEGVQIGKALYISFPTDMIFYPLIPMSAAKGNQIFLDVTVNGYVTPIIPEDLKPYSTGPIGLAPRGGLTTSYEVNGSISDSVETSFEGKKNLKLTRMFINSPSEYLTEDLWIKPTAPTKVLVTSIINTLFIPLAIVFYLFLSIIISLGIGSFTIRRIGFNKGSLVILGILNIFSIIGVLIGLIFLNRNIILTDVKHSKLRKFIYLVLFSFVFTVISVILGVVVKNYTTPIGFY